ncbi:eCIS core domain-containing protein [Pseudomonas sp. S2_F03]
MTEHALAPSAERDASPPKTAVRGLLLQRKCACGAGAGSSGECESCAAGRQQNLQRKSNGASGGQGVPDSVNETLARPGRPLDADTRDFMESRFGSDFAAVRVHDDSAAGASARDVDAHAFTVGQDIVFGDGQYQPHSDSGRHLLAHELAHTVQQQSLQRSGISNLADQGPHYQRLEREADFAADSVMRGQPLASGVLSQGGPRLSRKDGKGKSQDYEVESRYKDLEMSTGHKVTPEKKTTAKVKGKDKELASYDVDFLELHEVKGPVLKEWQSKAKAKALRAIITLQGAKAQEAGLWQMRVSSDELRSRWVNLRGWKMGDALNAAWQKAGGDAEFPKVGGATCEMDHIIELQVGGDNTQENIQVLDRLDNGMSGSLIKQQVFGLAQAIAQKIEEGGEAPPAQIRMVFADSKMKGTGKCGPCCKTGKKLGKPGKDGRADKSTETLIDYPVVAGGSTRVLRVSEKSKTPPIFESGIPENVAGAEILPGLLLMTLRRVGKGKDTINAMIDNRDRTRLPITLPAKGTGVVLDVAEDGGLTLSAAAKKNAGIAFTYDYLSPGVFTKLDLVPGGVAGEGYITPTKVPLLQKIEVAFSPEYFRLKAPLDKDKLKPPFAGVKITEASLAIDLAPKLKPVGTVAFEFGTAKKIAASKVEVSADENGLVLTGVLFVYLPGVDEAKGEIKYQAGEWSGGAHIESGQMAGKIPYVKSGAVDVFLKAGKIDATGKVNLELPGGNEAALEISYAANKWVFQGRGKIKVKSPYLKPIQASLWYDGELFIAKGQAGFAFSGLDGIIDATYENKGGKEKVYGKGDIKIDKGRAKGNIVVELLPNEKIIGKGTLSYEIKKDMVATAGITVDEQQKITFDGELSFPDITLFKRFPEKQEDQPIFSASGSIPIPGASIGPIGLKVKLWGSLGYYYYVGPGVLTGIKATVKFSPFEADPDFSFNLKAKASIPAGGGISGKVGADVVIDLYIAEVGGGLNVEARAGLEGKAELAGEIAYSKDKFSVDASAYIGGSVVLAAALNARVYAEAGVWRFKVRTEKPGNCSVAPSTPA